MRWQVLSLTVALVAGGGVVQAQPVSDACHDPTIVSALQLLDIARSDWPLVEFFVPGRISGGDGDLERFPAFRVRHGLRVDPAIYVNPRHRFYLEARDGGSDLYPLFRLASVIRHELQHGFVDHSEATALAAQATFLKRALIRIAPERRSNALAYIQSIEQGIAVTRDAGWTFPAVPR